MRLTKEQRERFEKLRDEVNQHLFHAKDLRFHTNLGQMLTQIEEVLNLDEEAAKKEVEKCG